MTLGIVGGLVFVGLLVGVVILFVRAAGLGYGGMLR